MKKGYEQKEAQEMALRIFENMEQLKMIIKVIIFNFLL